MNKLRIAVITFIVSALSVLIVMFSEAVSKSITESINVCLSSVIPSMFAYMALSSYMISCGVCRVIAKPLYVVFRRVIKLNEDEFCIFIMSLFGGYPVGAKLLKEKIAENKNYSEIAENMLTFCYCISPSFSVTMLGLGVFGSMDAGVIIYISNVISCFVCAIAMTHVYPMKAKQTLKTDRKASLIGSINSTTSSLALISAIIISFNIVLTVLNELVELVGFECDAILLGFAEISNLLKLGNAPPSILPLISSIATFGGLCVICQCSAICSNSINIKKFLIMRVPCSLLSGLITSVITNFWEISVETGISPNYSYSFSADKLVTVILICMSAIIFIKTEKFFKKV